LTLTGSADVRHPVNRVEEAHEKARAHLSPRLQNVGVVVDPELAMGPIGHATLRLIEVASVLGQKDEIAVITK
jgi:hypothetical protein